MPKGDKQKEKFKVDPEDVSSEIDFALRLVAWKNTEKIDVFDPEQCRKRVEEFFLLCRETGERPTVSAFASALGMRREYISDIYTGNFHHIWSYAKLPTESVRAICDGYDIIRMMVESNLHKGKGNPIAGIFLAKSMGIKDHDDNFESTTQKELPDLERLKNQYLNQLPQKEGD